MTPLGAAIAAGVAAAGLAFGLTRLVIVAGPIDRPGARTSHARPTPTSGGMAILAATGLGGGLFAGLSGAAGGEAAAAAATLAFAGLFGLIGALDDLFDFGARAKLLVQAGAALIFAALVARIEVLPLGLGFGLPLGPVAGALGTALWIVVVANAVNFMDGANGVAPGAMVVALAAFAAAAFQAHAVLLGGIAVAGAAAGAGFLPLNLRGRVFQGDVGSLFCGFLFAGLAVLATRARGHGAVFLYFGPLALLPLLTDVLLTLLWRARRGRSLLAAHRDHLYQLWLARTGGSHLALAWRVAAVMAVFGGAAVLCARAPKEIQPLVFAGGVIVAAAGWTLARRRLGEVAA